MSSYTTLLFAWRKPGLTPHQFTTYWETKHVPLIKSITGDAYPLSNKRHYIDRPQGEEAGGEASGSTSGSDSSAAATGDKAATAATTESYPANVMIGSPSDFEYDAIAELTWESRDAFNRFMAIITEPGNAARIRADEEKFLDHSKSKIVVRSRVVETRRD